MILLKSWDETYDVFRPVPCLMQVLTSGWIISPHFSTRFAQKCLKRWAHGALFCLWRTYLICNVANDRYPDNPVRRFARRA